MVKTEPTSYVDSKGLVKRTQHFTQHSCNIVASNVVLLHSFDMDVARRCNIMQHVASALQHFEHVQNVARLLQQIIVFLKCCIRLTYRHNIACNILRISNVKSNVNRMFYFIFKRTSCFHTVNVANNVA